MATPLGPHDHKRLPLLTAGGFREKQAFKNYCKVRGWTWSDHVKDARYCPDCDHIEINGARFDAGSWEAKTV